MYSTRSAASCGVRSLRMRSGMRDLSLFLELVDVGCFDADGLLFGGFEDDFLVGFFDEEAAVGLAAGGEEGVGGEGLVDFQGGFEDVLQEVARFGIFFGDVQKRGADGFAFVVGLV